MPFVLWIGAITGWLLLVVEAILAAPLWAIMHLHPNGDDLTGRGGNGYSLMLSLLLKPVLIVFGFIAAATISGVMGEFINKTFMQTFFANSSGDFVGLFDMIGGVVLYFTVMLTFVKKCFNLIFQLPEQILNWIGGGGGSAIGQFAQEFGQSADTGGKLAAGGIGAGTGMIGNQANRAGMRGLESFQRERAPQMAGAEGLKLSPRQQKLRAAADKIPKIFGGGGAGGTSMDESGRVRNQIGANAQEQAMNDAAGAESAKVASAFDAETFAGASDLAKSKAGELVSKGGASDFQSAFKSEKNALENAVRSSGADMGKQNYLSKFGERATATKQSDKDEMS